MLSDHERFIGTWRLVSATRTLANGQIEQIIGNNPIGYIMYTPSGIMSVQIMRQNRKLFHSEKPEAMSANEALTIPEDFFAYAGKFEVDSKNHIVLHHQETQLLPNNIGKIFKRSYRFEGNRLYLKPLDMGDDSILIWEKI